MGNYITKTEVNFTIRKSIDIFKPQSLGLPSFELFKKFMSEKGYFCEEDEKYQGTKFVGPHNFLYRLRIETFTVKIRIIAVYHMHPLHNDAWFYDNLNIVNVNHPVRNYKNVEQKLNDFIVHVRDFIDTYEAVQLYSSPNTVQVDSLLNSPEGSSPNTNKRKREESVTIGNTTLEVE